MRNLVNIFEMSPRDGLQNEKKFISTDEKVFLIDQLSQCGFNKIETSSLVTNGFLNWLMQQKFSEELIEIKTLNIPH